MMVICTVSALLCCKELEVRLNRTSLTVGFWLISSNREIRHDNESWKKKENHILSAPSRISGDSTYEWASVGTWLQLG